MNSAILKGSLAFVTVSGVAATGGAYFAGAFSGKEIEDKSFRSYLEKIGRTVVISASDWNELKTLYASAATTDLIPNVSKDSVSFSTQPLINWCRDKLKSDFINSEKNLVESWCSKIVKIGDRLSYFGLLALDTSSASVSHGTSTNADDGIWGTKSSGYGADTGKDATLKIGVINDSPHPKTLGDSIDSSASKEQLQKWCGWAKDQVYQYEESVLFKRYKHWCTKKKDL